MRTNIVINDELMEKAMKFSSSNTKRGVVEEALKLFIQIRKQANIQRLRGKLTWEGDLDQLRTDQ